MKKIICLCLAFVYSSLFFGQWTHQNSGTTENLNAVQFVNSSIGYVVGDNGTILKTSDSGASWTSLNSNTAVLLNSLFFVSIDTGFVSGSYYDNVSSSQVGVLLKTVDGGANWVDLAFPFEENLVDIFFINAQIGFASSLSDGLFRTIDGGINWSLVRSTNTKKVFFPSSLIGYALDDNPSGGAISKTTDGGLNWDQIKDGNSPDYNSANILTSIFFTSDNVGFFCSSYYGGIYATIDGGSSLNFTDTAIISISFPSATVGYAVSNFDGTKIIQTMDSGNNWALEYQGVVSLNDIFFANTNMGWAVGNQGTILYRDTPLGINEESDLQEMVKVYPNPSQHLLNIEFPQWLDVTQISLFDNLGGQIMEFKEKKTALSVEGLLPGQYHLTISTEKEVISKRIVIE